MAVAIPRPSGARSRNEGALTAALYKQHAGELLRFAWHRLGRLEDAEDAVQATFLSAHRVLAEGERVREPRAWLFRILRNECLTRLAMTKRRGVNEELGEWHADPRASVADQMESNDEFDIAVALLATLPEQQREAMVLREWLGMSAIETAGILDVTPQGVDALVYRARKALVGLADVAEESACADVRHALAEARLNARLRAHLLTCRSCRTAARRLHAPEEMAVANALLPLDSIASRLGDSIPGFVVAGGAAAAVGITSTIAVGTAAKVVVGVAIGAVVATGAVREAPAIRNALAPATSIQALPTAPPAKPAASDDGAKRIVSPQQAAAGSAAAAGGGAPAAAAAAAAAAGTAPGAAPASGDALVAGASAAVAVGAAAPAGGAASAPADAPPAQAPASGAAPATKPPAASTPPKPSADEQSSDEARKAAEREATKAEKAAEEARKAAERKAEKAAEEAKKAAERKAEKAAEEAKKAAELEAEQTKKAAEQAKKNAEKAAEQAKKNAEKAAEEAKKAAEKAAEAAPTKQAPAAEQHKPDADAKPTPANPQRDNGKDD